MAAISFNFQNYLTPTQQATYKQVPPSLQRRINEQLLASDYPLYIKIAQLILNIFKFDNFDNREIKEKFFLTILNGDNVDQQLEKVLRICQKGGSQAFFRCATTQEKTYYSAKTLHQIIQDFDNLAQATNHSLAPLSKCPYYDYGGKALLAKLIRTPAQLINLSLEDEETTRELLQIEATQETDFFNGFHSFLKMKQKAIHYLVLLPETKRSSMKIYLKVFKNLQNNPELVSVGDITRAAIIKLIVIASSHEQKPIVQKAFISDFDEMMQESISTYQRWGEEALLSICNAPNLRNNTNLNQIINCLKLLNILSDKADLISQIQNELSKFSKGIGTLAQLLGFLEALVPGLHANMPDTKEDVQAFINRFRKDINVVFSLPEENLKKIQNQYVHINTYCEEWKMLRIGQLVEKAYAIQAEAKDLGFNEDRILRLIAIGRLAIFIKLQIYPHIAQVLTVLEQLCFEKGAIAQVKTGEGKSIIVTLLAFVLAIQKKSVHIISSSRNLSIRDQFKAESFFNTFGITTSHICEDHPSANRFQAQILYGMTSDFEFAVMREMLYFQLLFPQKISKDSLKRFDCVIIDELDNLTIDTASNQARLSYPMEETYDWVYFPIFDYVRKNIKKDESQKISQRSSIADLRKWLREYSGKKFQEMEQRLSDDQLQEWLSSAYIALHFREENKHYIVHNNREKEGKSIVIVDAENTGRLMWNSRWGKGIHEFLEVKHDLTPEKESLTPLSLSHAVFYELYKALFGLTGTLGSEFERAEIKEIYGASSFDVPTYKPSLRQDLPLKILPSKQLYLRAILETAKTFQSKKRPLLILCRTISDSKEIEKLLRENQIPLEMLNEIQDKNEEEILRKAGYPGAITVATNTAGRGTDIKLEGESEGNGGLHVLLTFYPESQRVEDQARGRAGRQGQKGSSEIVVSLEDLKLDHRVDIMNPHMHATFVAALKEKRASQARIVKNLHIVQAEIERYCFTFVRNFFDLFGRFHNMIEQEEIVRQWATQLSTRKITPKEINLLALRPKDHQIAQTALAHLTDTQENTLSWQILLKQIAERLENNIINDWSNQFYKQTEVILSESGATASVLLRDKLQEAMSKVETNTAENDPSNISFFQLLEAFFTERQRADLDDLKQKLQALYNLHKNDWEKTLDPSGLGLIQYLRRTTQTSLKGLESAI